jgi:hypothetical protein
MLRMVVIALALGLPGLAKAQQFPDSAIGAAVVADNGAVVGYVDHVVRDGDGRIVATEIEGQEPASAPYAPRELVASAERSELMVVVADRRDDRRDARGSAQTRAR